MSPAGRIALLISGMAVVQGLIGTAQGQSVSGVEVRHYAKGSDQDPRVRLAQYYQGEQRYFSAASTLLSIESDSPGERLPPSFYRHLADNTLGFGLPARAEHSYREAIPNTQHPLELGKSQLQLASQLYIHGRYDDALHVLQAIRSTLPSDLFTTWQSLAARANLALDRSQDAVDVTVQPDNSDDQSPYQIYNLAIALLRIGRTKDGLTELNLVGRMHPSDSDTLALRDKANLLLGYHYLRQKQGDNALKMFERIRFKGPYSNRALLGVGWARLTEKGKQPEADTADQPATDPDPYSSLSSIGALIRPGFLDNVIARNARVKQLRRLELRNVAPGKEAALRAALVPWSVLLSRDPMDPAVQECMLAVPYALDRIGAHLEAKEFYEKAIDALQQTKDRLATAKLDIKSNRMVDTIIKRDEQAQSGWMWRLTDLPDAVETFYLQPLIADHPFQDSIKNYRDLKLMLRTLDTLDGELSDLQASRSAGDDTSITVQYLVDQARRGKTGDFDLSSEGNGVTSAPLRMSERLSDDGSAAGSVGAEGNVVKPDLELAAPPVHFEGAWEHIARLRKEIDLLRPDIKHAITQVNQRLQDMALQDLDQQDEVASRYLVEARFALARLYDSGGPDNGDSP